VDNIGCDPQTWNNHGSIEEYKGQWYVFYHRSSQNGRYNRRLCIEPIEFDENGDIREVLPTTQGVEEPISVKRRIDASTACRMGGWGACSFIAPDAENEGSEMLNGLSGNGWAAYRYVNFDAPVSVCAIGLQADGCGRIEIWADDRLLGRIGVSPTAGGYVEERGKICSCTGVHTLYVEWQMDKGSRAKLREIWFE